MLMRNIFLETANLARIMIDLPIVDEIRSEKEVYVFPDFGHDILPGQDDRMFQFLMDL